MQDTFWCTTSASWWGTWRTSRNRENRNYKRFGKSCSQTMCSFQLLRWLGFYSLGKIFQGLLYYFSSLFFIKNYTLLVFYKEKGSLLIFFSFYLFFSKDCIALISSYIMVFCIWKIQVDLPLMQDLMFLCR